MATPLRRDLLARRNTPFSEGFTFTEQATGDPINFSGAVVTLQVRQYGAQAGEALIDLVEVGLPLTEGIIAADGAIDVFIDEVTLALLPLGRPGESVNFVYDLVVDLSGAVPEIWAQGLFTVKPGVTDRLGIRNTEDDDVRITEDGDVRVTE